MRFVYPAACAAFLLPLPLGIVLGEEAPARDKAKEALRRATAFFRREVAVQGGYLWRYSADLKLREGEGKASDTTAWVQPPGTPSVGGAFLEAYELTGDKYYLEAARETGLALVRGQLRSGGWDYRIEFDPRNRRRMAYRADPPNPAARNVTTLDDNTTQEAIRFLARLDRALRFKDGAIHDAAVYALDSLVRAQYPNGAWPQRFERPPEPAEFPVRNASYPDAWPRKHPSRDYRSHYTFNDNTIADVIDVMFLAAEIYDAPRYRAAADRAGSFLLLAQMPEPQPGWAQQYDAEMHPAWARKFEPPAITGGESRGVIRTLMRLYRETADPKFLEPIPPALEYYRRCVLRDGRMARFYELKTNKPLYFTKQYELTYDDGDLPTHYGFKVGDWTAEVAREFDRLRSIPAAELKPRRDRARPRFSPALARRTTAVIAALDKRGAWVEPGNMKYHDGKDSTREVIDCKTFCRNIRVLADYLAATREEPR